MKKLFFSFLIVSMLFFSCESTRKGLTEAEIIQLHQEASKMLADYFSDIGDGGLLAEFEHLDSSDQFYWVPPGYNSALDYDSVRKVLIRNAPMWETIEFEWDTLTIIPLSHEYINYSGTISTRMVDTAGSVFTSKMLETGILIRRTEGWKIFAGQSRLVE